MESVVQTIVSENRCFCGIVCSRYGYLCTLVRNQRTTHWLGVLNPHCPLAQCPSPRTTLVQYHPHYPLAQYRTHTHYTQASAPHH
jgi:hypothetical protein